MKELMGTAAARTWLESSDAGPVAIQGADMEAVSALIAKGRLSGSILLGCGMEEALRARLQQERALLLPDLGLLPSPLTSFRTELYSISDLYAGFDPQKEGSWKGTPDNLGWSFFMKDEVTPNPLDIAQSAAARLHDTSIERAVYAKRAEYPICIGIMGGHDVRRDAPAYKQVVEIARALRRKDYLILTGGGPGLMEAGNLGAFLAPYPDNAIDVALGLLPERNFKSHAWLATAAEVRIKLNGAWDTPGPEGGTSLAIPTWLYGHEPPNLFSSHIGKMFFNSLREDGLVTVANGGLLFGPGNAGTVQEIFQDLTQNYYRNALSATPMVFLDSAYWSRPCDSPLTFPPKKNPNKPLLPLVRQLAAEKDFLSSILVSDDPAEIVRFLDRGYSKPKVGLRVADVRLMSRVADVDAQKEAAP